MLKPVLIILHQEHSSPGRVGQMLTKLGYSLDVRVLPCGHYSLELFPFSYAAALAMGLFLFRNLA